jgi:hypothetical protein
LLLTLLAVPVFYSIFEDASELRAWQYISGRLNAVKAAVRRGLTGGSRPADAYPLNPKKEKYLDESGD